MRPWFVYLLECRDGSVYTGIAVDVARRYAQHEAGKGARYTRSRPPVRLLGQLAFADRSTASRAEHAIKQLPPLRKRVLFAGDPIAAAMQVLARLDPVESNPASKDD
jgi:putative endonuclease